jgi:hypothetical protein
MSNTIEFYNVRKRAKVKIFASEVSGRVMEKESKDGTVRVRYAFSAVDDDGTKMLKFCSKADYEELIKE